MSNLGLFNAVTSILAAITFMTLPSPANADAGVGGPCVRTEFQTEFVKQACAKGGQQEAKQVMKQFDKDNQITSCNECHTNLAPKYKLKYGALLEFQKLGGK